MNSEKLKSPLCLKSVREYFERNFCGRDFSDKDVPVSSYIMGIVTGYRLVRTDYDSTQICLDLSQGSNEEFRLQYTGMSLYDCMSIVSSRHLDFSFLF